MNQISRQRRVVPETYVQLLFEYLESQGVAPEKALGRAWPQPDPSGPIGVDEDAWAEMLETSARILQDPLLALKLGHTVSPRHLGVMGAVFLACDNLASALQRLERYQRLIFDTVPMTPRVGASGAIELVWETFADRTSRLVDEVGLAVLVQFCRGITRGPVNPTRIEFTHANHSDLAAYEEFFGCEVLFQSQQLVLAVNTEVLQAPLKSADPGLVRLLEQHAERLLEQLPDRDGIVPELRRCIASLLSQGEPKIEDVCTLLASHPRKLQRDLQLSGTSFRKELQAMRHQLAESYLRDRRLQIVDIALLLGFSEHSAFTRSFRNWSGKTPKQFREQHFNQC